MDTVAEVLIIKISTYLPLCDVARLATVEQKIHSLQREMFRRVNKLSISERNFIPDLVNHCPNAQIVEMVGPETLTRGDFELLSILPIEIFTSCRVHLVEWDGFSIAFRGPIKLRMPQLKSITVYGAHFYDFSECPIATITDKYPNAEQLVNHTLLEYFKSQFRSGLIS